MTQSLELSRSDNRSGYFSLFLLCLIAGIAGYLWNVRPDLSPNDNARWDTIWSLVEFNSYQITDNEKEAKEFNRPIQLMTIDKVRKDGKTYSSKPPLLPTAMAGLVKLMKVVIREPFSKDVLSNGKLIIGSIHIYGKGVLFVFNLLPFVLMIISFERFVRSQVQDEFHWFLAVMAMAVGTLLTGYLVTVNNHVPAAVACYFAARAFLCVTTEDDDRPIQYFLCGLFSALTAVNELPAGMLVAFVLGALAARDFKKTIVYAVPPVVMLLAANLVTNYISLGTWSPAYVQKSLYVFPDSYWSSDQKKSGIDALNENPESLIVYLFHMTFGHHGLFSLSPILLIAAVGAWENLRSNQRMRNFTIGTIILTSIVFGFYWIINDQRNYGGFCHGMRWLFWLIPLWLFWLPAGLERIGKLKYGHGFATAALAVSIFSATDCWYSPWTRSWLHRIMIWFRWIDY